jgi:hypothetical protein
MSELAVNVEKGQVIAHTLHSTAAVFLFVLSPYIASTKITK